jgi:hypothetical protein
MEITHSTEQELTEELLNDFVSYYNGRVPNPDHYPRLFRFMLTTFMSTYTIPSKLENDGGASEDDQNAASDAVDVSHEGRSDA